MTRPDSSTPTPGASTLEPANLPTRQSGRHASESSTSATSSESIVHPSLEAHATALMTALHTLAEQMQGMEYGAEHLQCSEAEAICDVLILSGHVGAADALRDYHAEGDNEGYEQHHARWHELNESEPADCCLPDFADDHINRIKEG